MLIHANKGLIFGDLHISDRFTGRHKNYLANCFNVMGEILGIVKKEKPDYVAFLGDIVGLREKVIQRREILLHVCNFFRELNSLTNNNVYSVRGNHDMGDFSEFDFLAGMGLIKTTASLDGNFLDVFPKGVEQIHPEVRLHFVDYGQERKDLDILKDGATSNIVLGHNNFTVAGLTNWYQQHDGIELGSLGNFAGVDLVVAGHIHNPSPYEIETPMPYNSGNCMLVYLGCPTRPSFDQGKYETVWYGKLEYSPESEITDWSLETFELAPKEEVFFTEDEYVEEKTEEQINEELRTKNLKDVLDDILHSRMTSGDLFNQINIIPYASDRAKALASEYLRRAIDNVNPRN